MDSNELKKARALVSLVTQHVKTNQVTIAEIGVYLGFNATHLLKALVKQNYDVTYYGFDLFEDVTKYNLKQTNPGVYNDIVLQNKVHLMSVGQIANQLNNIGAKVTLIRGDTKATIPKCATELKDCDFFYIDGGHDYASVKADWDNINRIAKGGSMIVFDDCNKYATGICKLVREVEQDLGVRAGSAYGSRKYFVKQ